MTWWEILLVVLGGIFFVVWACLSVYVLRMLKDMWRGF